MAPRKRKLDATKGDEPNEGHLYKCTLCSQTFQRGCGLASHMRRHAPVVFNCSRCDYTCKHKYAYDRHLAQSHPNIFFEQSGPLERILSDDDEEEMPVLERQTGDGGEFFNQEPLWEDDDTPPATPQKVELSCPRCELTFDNRQRLVYHLQCHRQKSWQAKGNPTLYYKKVQRNKAKSGFRLNSRDIVKWRLNCENRPISLKRLQVRSFMEEIVGCSLHFKADEKAEESDDDAPPILVKNGPFMSRKMLRMKNGSVFGQKLTINEDSFYFCRACPYTTWNISSLWRHFRRHDQTADCAFSCTTCSYNTVNEDDMEHHVKMHKQVDETDKEFTDWVTFERQRNKSDWSSPQDPADIAEPPKKKFARVERVGQAPRLVKAVPTVPKVQYKEPVHGLRASLPRAKKNDRGAALLLQQQEAMEDEPCTSSSSSSQPSCSSYSAPPPPPVVTTPAVPKRPVYEDFLYIKPVMPLYLKERHPLEASGLYESALEDYEKMINKPPLKVAKFNIKYEDLHPLAKAQYGRNNPREYLMREQRIERSGQCADCPFHDYKNLERFRHHRDRHYYGGPHKCKECNYATFDRMEVRQHMLFDHYINDVKTIEGISSSESEEEEPPIVIEKPKKKRGRGRRGRRRND